LHSVVVLIKYLVPVLLSVICQCNVRLQWHSHRTYHVCSAKYMLLTKHFTIDTPWLTCPLDTTSSSLGSIKPYSNYWTLFVLIQLIAKLTEATRNKRNCKRPYRAFGWGIHWLRTRYPNYYATALSVFLLDRATRLQCKFFVTVFRCVVTREPPRTPRCCVVWIPTPSGKTS